MNRGIVLVGGGARGAYQAGVLKGIARIIPREELDRLFQIITGTSAGAVNGAFIAAHADRFHNAVDDLCRLWEKIRFEDVFKSHPFHLAKIVGKWVKGLAGGKLKTNYLLDTTPVQNLLREKIDFSRIREHVESGILAGFALSATNYHTGSSITFFDAPPDVKNWERSGRLGVRAELRTSHLLASASLPLLFEPVWIGCCQFGDGSIRQAAPLAPAIHLGSDRVIAVSVQPRRQAVSAAEIVEEVNEPAPPISIAGIVGLILNSAFFEGIDFDSERMLRINRTVDHFAELYAENGSSRKVQPLAIRKIPLLLLRPSEDPATIALEHFPKFPPMVRYFMRMLGASGENGADLMSYLAFDSSYTKRLIEMGVRDVRKRADEIRDFFRQESLSLPSQVPILKERGMKEQPKEQDKEQPKELSS